jgi:PAS domain S-box-containing protein
LERRYLNASKLFSLTAKLLSGYKPYLKKEFLVLVEILLLALLYSYLLCSKVDLPLALRTLFFTVTTILAFIVLPGLSKIGWQLRLCLETGTLLGEPGQRNNKATCQSKQPKNTETNTQKLAASLCYYSFSGRAGDADLLKAPEGLTINEERFHMIFNNIKIGLILLDTDGKICDVNSAMEDILGFSKQEMKNKLITDFFHPDDARDDNSPLKDLATGTQTYCDIEKRLLNKQGEVLWIRLIGSLVVSSQSKPFSILAIENISDKKETEKIKDAFVDMVAHELKNPLMAVISSLRLAKKDGQFLDVLHELIEIASDSAESLWSILENMLEVSRARAGRLKLKVEKHDIAQLIKGVLGTVNCTLIHHLVTEIPDNLPPVMVDPARIHLVLRNLIDNAIKYSPKGGDILIFAKRVEGEIVIGVKDHGIGISKADLQKLFQPFERLEIKDTMGSGLGLAVCRVLITYHKGRIWLESEQGKGSTFFFALPVS